MLPRLLTKLLALVILAVSWAACSADIPSAPRQPSLSLAAAPVIVLSKTSIRLCYPKACLGNRSSPTYTYLDITNGGGGTLAWTATKNKTWLRKSPSTGTAPSRVKVWVDQIGLPNPVYSPYYGQITISAPGASNSPQTVWVNVRVSY
jgi:hypothetical protein